MYGGTGDDVMTGGDGNDGLYGEDGNDTLVGGAGNDTLQGGNGTNILDGGSGADVYYGGGGSDRYVLGGLGNIQDNIIENGGTDTVEFGAGVSTSQLSLFKEGNYLRIAMNGSSDYLYITNWFYSGIYQIEQFQFADGTVWTPSQLEALGLTVNGTAGADSLSGSSISTTTDTIYGLDGNDTIYGYGGNDSLDGGSGADYMSGGTGDDTYSVDYAGDVVAESTNEGTDTVRSAITYTLGSNVENLTLTGTSAVNGTGNTLNNVLTGNSGVNTLTGGSGNDTLNGDAGNDALVGGTGNDTYVFGTGYGTDTVQENDSTGGNTDTVQLGVNPIDIVFAQATDNLDLTIHGATDKMTVQSWYTGSAYQTEVFTAADGSHLLSSQVSQLIQAMATFCTSNGLANWDQAITERPQDVQGILAQYWAA